MKSTVEKTGSTWRKGVFVLLKPAISHRFSHNPFRKLRLKKIDYEIRHGINWKRLQRRGLMTGKPSPGIAEVIIHPPIETKGLTKDDADALLIKLRDIINAPLHEKYGV